MKNLKKNNIILLLGLFITLFNFKHIHSSEIKIIFKIGNKAFTTIDYDLRVKYLDFVGNNINLSEDVIIEDYISASLFYYHFKTLNKQDNFDLKINQIYENINKINEQNKKVYKYEIDKENILFNLKIDFIRKSILENILSSNKDINKPNTEIDLLYNFTVKYINFESDILDEIKIIIKNLDDINLLKIKKILKENNINYFVKEKEVDDINKVNKIIKKNILENKNLLFIERENKISIVLIEKSFETLEGLVADIYSIRSNIKIEKKYLECKNLINKSNNSNISNKEYRFSDLNNELKKNLININDYITYEDNNQKIYIVLCDIKFNKEILSNFNLNKIINSNVIKIEKNFIIKYSKIYNLIKVNA